MEPTGTLGFWANPMGWPKGHIALWKRPSENPEMNPRKLLLLLWHASYLIHAASYYTLHIFVFVQSWMSLCTYACNYGNTFVRILILAQRFITKLVPILYPYGVLQTFIAWGWVTKIQFNFLHVASFCLSLAFHRYGDNAHQIWMMNHFFCVAVNSCWITEPLQYHLRSHSIVTNCVVIACCVQIWSGKTWVVWSHVYV